MTPETWRLHSVAWQLIHTLQRTLGGLTGAFWEARSGLAGLHSSGSRRASGSGEQSPGVPSPRELPPPGSANHLLENGKPGAPSAALPGPPRTLPQGYTLHCSGSAALLHGVSSGNCGISGSEVRHLGSLSAGPDVHEVA